MKRSLWGISLVATAVLTPVVNADTLLHRQAPGRTFGFTSDTAARDDFDSPSSELIADKFPGPALPVCRVVWWSFYGSSLAQEVEPPPLSETVRIRFLSDAAGLPGALLWEEQFLNPPRQATGFSIATGPGPPEFRYQVDLVNCFAPQLGASYWIEIAQLDDLNSRFRWENSNTPGEYAFQFPIGNPWQVVINAGQMAYELRTPEPASGASLAIVSGFLLWRGKR